MCWKRLLNSPLAVPDGKKDTFTTRGEGNVLGVGWGWGRQVLKRAGFQRAQKEEEWKSAKRTSLGEEGPGWKGLGEAAGHKLGMCYEGTTCILTLF